MNVILGVLGMIAGVAFFVFAPRMVRANEASSAALFGRFDPYKKAPRFTRIWSLTICRVVAAFIVVMSLLTMVGVIDIG